MYMESYSTPETHHKGSLRTAETGELVLDQVKVPKENILPGVEGLKGPLSCLNQARYGIAWGAIGAAMDCYDTALRYSGQRTQFGKPIAAFQLQQKKLAEMITEITKARSEEHTSELPVTNAQLVCRLLLKNKKNTT